MRLDIDGANHTYGSCRHGHRTLAWRRRTKTDCSHFLVCRVVPWPLTTREQAGLVAVTGSGGGATVNRRSLRRSAWLAVALAVTVAAEDVKPTGRVSLSVGPRDALEGGAAVWTVTAAAGPNSLPADGRVLEVGVVSADDRADASYDYERVDHVVRSRRSDFARARGAASRRGVFAGRYNPVDLALGRRWIARKSAAVRILEDGMVEESETFMLMMSITEGVGWASDAKEGVRVRIRDTDTWGLALAASPQTIVEGETSEVELTARIVRGDGVAPPPRTCVVPFPVRLRLVIGGNASRRDDYTLNGLPDVWRVPACAPEVSWMVRLATQGGDEPDADETVRFTPLAEGFQEYGRIATAFLTQSVVTIRQRH